MKLGNLARRIGTYRRRRGTLATMQFLASRIVRHQRHVVFEAILDTAPVDVPWLEGERLKVIDRIAGITRRIEFRLVHLRAPLRVHSANVHDEAVEIAEHRIPCPLAGRIVAQHDFIAVLAQLSAPVAKS